jgi:hypothetical protein
MAKSNSEIDIRGNEINKSVCNEKVNLYSRIILKKLRNEIKKRRLSKNNGNRNLEIAFGLFLGMGKNPFRVRQDIQWLATFIEISPSLSC